MTRLDQVGKTATTIYHDGEFTCVKYHATDVVKFNQEKIILNSGGWHTNTTKTRINQAANQFGLDFRVYAKDFIWYIDYDGKTLEFKDHVELEREFL